MQTRRRAVTEPMPAGNRRIYHATVIEGYDGAKDGDGFFCLNFRADRAREIMRAIGAAGF